MGAAAKPVKVPEAILDSSAAPVHSEVVLVGAQYAVRHAVAHGCQADNGALLESILHNLGMWQASYAVGKANSQTGVNFAPIAV